MNKVLPFILIVLCISTANADYESNADATLMQIKTESALKSNDEKLLNEIQNVEEVHTGDTLTLEGDISSTRVYSASSYELKTPKGKEQAKAAQVMVGLPVRKHFLSKDFANRDVSELFIQTPKGEVNYSTLAKTMGWTDDDSSYYGEGSDRDKQDAKAFYMGDDSFDQKAPESSRKCK